MIGFGAALMVTGGLGMIAGMLYGSAPAGSTTINLGMVMVRQAIFDVSGYLFVAGSVLTSVGTLIQKLDGLQHRLLPGDAGQNVGSVRGAGNSEASSVRPDRKASPSRKPTPAKSVAPDWLKASPSQEPTLAKPVAPDWLKASPSQEPTPESKESGVTKTEQVTTEPQSTEPTAATPSKDAKALDLPETDQWYIGENDPEDK